MSITIYQSKEIATDTPDMFPPCCGRQPKVYRWKRQQLISVMCVNPECENRIGVLACDVDINAKWNKYRVD